MSELQQFYTAEINSMQHKLDEANNRLGITVSEYVSAEPLALEIDFQHAYGHLMVQLVAQFDRICRYNETLKRGALLTTQEAKGQLNEVQNKFKSLLEFIKDRQRKIELVSIVTRDLLLLENNAKADQVIQEIVSALGPVPKAVLMFEWMPAYMTLKNAYHITEENKQKMLANAVRLGLVDEVAE